jgi:P4 family phage/plasmid primase-like protien
MGEGGWCCAPAWSIVLPFPGHDNYGVARIEYEIYGEGEGKPPGKFQNPSGPAVPFIPRSASKRDLLDPRKPLYFVEGSFKAAAAAAHGLLCCGANGHTGVFESETNRTKIRPDLLPCMKPGRTVCFLTDADVAGNLDVRKSQLCFLDVAAKLGCQPVFVELPDLGDGKSGIDDYLAKHSLKAFLKRPRHPRDSQVVRNLRCALFDLTELGLSDRFVALHGGDCRHDPRLGEWFSYTDKGYESSEVEPRRRMIEVVRSLPAETAATHGEDSIKARRKFEKECGRNSVKNAALAFAADDRAVEIDAALFDAEQDLLGTQNGVLQLSTGKLLKPDRKLMVTKRLACIFDAKATAPQWLKFLQRICDGQRDLINYLQEIAGACLAGRSTRQEVFFLNGTGKNGKSVFIETLNRMLHDYAVAVPSKLLLRQQRGGDSEKATPFLVKLHGKRLATCSELNENQPVDEATIKDLSGGDLIAARANYGHAFQFRNTARILVRCNHLPVVVGTDAAIWDRLIVVPFLVEIPLAEQDVDLQMKLATELPGVLRWALAGLHRLAERGFHFESPLVVRELTHKHRTDSDVIGTWLDECVELNATANPPWRELQGEVTQNYTDWAHANNHGPMSSKNLWAKLRERLGFDPIYRGDGGLKYAKCLRLRRGVHADNVIANLHRELDAVKTRLAIAEAEKSGPEATTPPTPYGKKRFRIIEGGK